MSSFRFFFKYSREFLRHWGSYILLIVGTNVVLEFAVIPIVQEMTAFILKRGDIPYVSNTNILIILTEHPAVLAALLFLLAVVLLLIFLQFTFQFFGIRAIQTREDQTLWALFKQSLSQIKHLRPTTFFFFLFYFLLILPFANAIFRTPLLSKVTIPIFILEFLRENHFFSILLVLSSFLVSYLGIRLLFVLPLMIFKKAHPIRAMKESFALTRYRFWHYVWRIFLLTTILSFLSYIGYVASYAIQGILDLFPRPIPIIGAMITLTSIQLFSQLMLAWATVLYFSVLIQKFHPLVISEEKPLRLIRHPRLFTRIAASVLFSLLGLSILVSNGLYLMGSLDTRPVAISHRGVDNKNGVQNTISAMKKTIAEKPDYIEMDVQETKDHQFVVMHDYNLKKLTGVDKEPQELTLKELTSLTARENGQAAPVASFDEYLAFANTHKQKLFIEIKTTSKDSPDMMDRFIKKYKKLLKEHHHVIQSLDYEVVRKTNELAPSLSAQFILPYNLVFPQTVASGYTMEETTLTSGFVEQAHQENKAVYAWTVNDKDAMDRMIFLSVDGIITDDLRSLQKQIKAQEDHPSYAKRLWLYIHRLPSLDERITEN